MKSVLILVDGSPRAQAAVESVAEMARGGSVRNAVLLNVQPRLDGYARRCAGTRAVDGFFHQAAARELEPAARMLEEAGIPCRVVVRSGGMVESVLRTAAELRVDEIVVGIDSTLAGFVDFYTVITRIIRRTATPVSVVKVPSRRPVFGGRAHGWQFRPTA